MSELYLVLKRRLDSVAEWVELGTDEMQAAQNRLGLSNERLAPKLYIASKTWERWKKRGAVPRRELERVASVLGMVVETTQPVTLNLPEGGATAAEFSRLRSELAKIAADFAALEAQVLEAPDDPGPTGTP